MGFGANADPIQPLTSVLPGLREKPSGLPSVGVQKVVSVPLVTKTGASTTYKVGGFVAPSDGWWVKEIWISAMVKPNYDTATLAIDNYDKSAAAARNVLSGTNFDLESIGTVLKGEALALSATAANLYMDEGDFINCTVAIGANEVAAGEGLAITLVLVGPEID